MIWHKGSSYRYVIFLFEYTRKRKCFFCKSAQVKWCRGGEPLFAILGVTWPYPTPIGYVDMESPACLIRCSTREGKQSFTKPELLQYFDENGWEPCYHAELQLRSTSERGEIENEKK